MKECDLLWYSVIESSYNTLSCSKRRNDPALCFFLHVVEHLFFVLSLWSQSTLFQWWWWWMKEAKRCSFLNGLLKQTWDSLFLLIISESFCKWNEFFNVFMYGKYATKNPNQWFDFYFFVLLMYLFQSGDVIMIVIFLKTLKIDLIMTLLFCATVCVFKDNCDAVVYSGHILSCMSCSCAPWPPASHSSLPANFLFWRRWRPC